MTDPGDYNLFTVPDRVAGRRPGRRSTTPPTPLEPLLRLWEELPEASSNFPARLPQDAGRAARVQPSKKVAEHWDEDGNRGSRPVGVSVTAGPVRVWVPEPGIRPGERSRRGDEHAARGPAGPAPSVWPC